MGLEINKIPSNDTIALQKPTNVYVFQLKSEKGKEGRQRQKRSGRRKEKEENRSYCFQIITWLH